MYFKKPMHVVLGNDFCMLSKFKQVLFIKEDLSENHAKVNIRLHNYPESMIALKNLKAAYIGNIVNLFNYSF